jgi:uncharacterized protein (DUF1697 family)
MARRIVLLRGVNVGNRKLPMSGLREMLTGAGCDDVVTYIQSGNVVLSPPADAPADLGGWLERLIGGHAGFDVPVVLRTADELASIVDRNPFARTGGSELHVIFCSEPPPGDALATLHGDDFGRDRFHLDGSEIYMHLPDGMGRAKLPVAIERALKRCSPSLAGTARNWNTVVKLTELSTS